MAQTLLSTIPVGRNSSRSVFSPMSVGTPEDFLGQATQIAPSGGIIVIARLNPRSASAALSAKIKNSSAGASRRWTSTSSGRSPRSKLK